jgi:probable F420-dependent oxidoreductase
LGSQIKPHIVNRYSMPWSRPAARMRELVLAIRAIWDAWDGVAPLRFEGEFYRHTLMTPAFAPAPHRYGRAPIHVAGVGPAMTAVAGEVGDGIIIHPFNTRRSLEELTMPALAQGRARAADPSAPFETVCVCLVATGATAAEFDATIAAVKSQLSFYASTPAYRPVLEVHGWEGVHATLNRMSKEGRWSDMADLISDEMLETIAVVGHRDEIAPLVQAKVDGIAGTVSIECTRRPDPDHFADIVAGLKR